jgi:hypothetical protein
VFLSRITLEREAQLSAGCAFREERNGFPVVALSQYMTCFLLVLDPPYQPLGKVTDVEPPLATKPRPSLVKRYIPPAHLHQRSCHVAQDRVPQFWGVSRAVL